MKIRASLVTVAGLLLAGCSGGADPDGTSATPTPAGRGVVVIGHSGATGMNSDPAHPGGNAPENSWATGTNPEVNSIYQRLAAQDPSYRPLNLAQNGAAVDALVRQARAAVTQQPKPDVVLIQGIDNDIRRDGTDPQNYAPFGAAFTTVLKTLADGLPDAKMYVLGLAGTVQEVATMMGTIPGLPASMGGDGLCDLFDPTGRMRPDGIAYVQDAIDRYEAETAKACARFPACRTDEGALRKMPVAAADLSDDGHPSIQGHRRQAEYVWNIFFS